MQKLIDNTTFQPVLSPDFTQQSSITASESNSISLFILLTLENETHDSCKRHVSLSQVITSGKGGTLEATTDYSRERICRVVGPISFHRSLRRWFAFTFFFAGVVFVFSFSLSFSFTRPVFSATLTIVLDLYFSSTTSSILHFSAV